MTGLSSKSAQGLRPLLDAWVKDYPFAERLLADPVEFPRRYRDPRDVEVSALLSASLAYGRVSLFKPKLEGLHRLMGNSPADFVRQLNVQGAAKHLQGFVYRFNVGTDLAVLLLGMGRALREWGSLEALFASQLGTGEDFQGALRGFTTELRRVPLEALRQRMGPERGLHHLLPSPDNSGAAKRLNLFLRWMVRGPDQVDLGIWKRIPPESLRIPLDTHILRLAGLLGLTRRKDTSWKTVEEITQSLRRMDPGDPVRYDFALCHLGMSGACPVRPVQENCRRCPLRAHCKVGRRT